MGDRKLHRKVGYAGQEQTLHEVARPSPWEAKKPVRMGRTRSWYFSTQRRIPDVHHPVRVLLFWRERGDQEARTALVRNRLGGEGMRLVWVSRHRWTGTETLHRDGKPPWGLGDGQVRRGEGQTRHGYRVRAAESLLRRSLQPHRVQDGARRTLTTSGEAWRAVQAETLERMIDGVVDKLGVIAPFPTPRWHEGACEA